MSGTIDGGKKCAATNKRKYGSDWYKKIGAIGGRNGNTGGFAANPELAREAGRKGGKLSKRGPNITDRERKVKKAKKMSARGATYEEMSKELGVSYGTIRRYLNEEN
jgi:general stress protein YciG